MLAVRTHAAGEPLRFEEVPVPVPRGTEVLVRVAGAGVCHTDLHVARTDRIRVDRPVTLGHEVAGWIAGMGADAGGLLKKARLREDEPVAVFGGWGCGECTECRRGEEQRCERSRAPGFQVDGGYAVEVSDGSGNTRLIGVEAGLFADGWVEVTGDGLAVGDQVVVP